MKTRENTFAVQLSYRADEAVRFYLAQHPLTEDMVTLSLGSATYSGAELKPTIAVQKGETTLAEGMDTKTVKPKTGNTVRPGTETEPNSGSTEETRPDPDIPFIKDEDGKIGWDVIRAEEEQAKEGSVISVDMNGTTVVPGGGSLTALRTGTSLLPLIWAAASFGA